MLNRCSIIHDATNDPKSFEPTLGRTGKASSIVEQILDEVIVVAIFDLAQDDFVLEVSDVAARALFTAVLLDRATNGAEAGPDRRARAGALLAASDNPRTPPIIAPSIAPANASARAF